MPYENEHSCRLIKPIADAPTKRVNNEQEHDGKKYHVIYQQQKDKKWKQQAYRYDKKVWTSVTARAHCKSHDGILFEPAKSIENVDYFKTFQPNSLKIKDLLTQRLKLKDIFPEQAKKFSLDMNVTEDSLELIRKGFATDDIEIKDGERAVIKYVSTPSLDRDKEIILPDGIELKEFRKSPIVLFAHDHRQLPIGKDLWIKPDDKGLLAKTVYASKEANPFAEQIYLLQKEGILNASSIGFIPISWANQGTSEYEKAIEKLIKQYGITEKKARNANRIFTKIHLLEHSDVPVPSNPDALNVAIGKGIEIGEDLQKLIMQNVEPIKKKELPESITIAGGNDNIDPKYIDLEGKEIELEENEIPMPDKEEIDKVNKKSDETIELLDALEESEDDIAIYENEIESLKHEIEELKVVISEFVNDKMNLIDENIELKRQLDENFEDNYGEIETNEIFPLEVKEKDKAKLTQEELYKFAELIKNREKRIIQEMRDIIDVKLGKLV